MQGHKCYACRQCARIDQNMEGAKYAVYASTADCKSARASLLQVIAIVERILSGEDPDMTNTGLTPEELALAGGPTGPTGPAAHGLSQAAVMRFIKMVSLTMADQLRTAVLSSIKACCEFWKQYDFGEAEEQEARRGHQRAKAGYPVDRTEADRWGRGGAGKDVEAANVWYQRTHRAPTKWGEDLNAAWPPPLLLISLQVGGMAGPARRFCFPVMWSRYAGSCLAWSPGQLGSCEMG